MAPLSPEQIAHQLSTIPGWSVEAGELVRRFQFSSFRAALGFVNLIAEAAEAACHHPDIDIRYNRVRLALVTHDEGGLTGKDFALAAQADKLAEKAAT